MCWFIRRIQPLQHHVKFMHEYTSDRTDTLRISVDNFSSDSVKLRLMDIVKVKDKNRGFTITYDMYVDGKCPKVGIYFPCMTLLQFFRLANTILSNTVISYLTA